MDDETLISFEPKPTRKRFNIRENILQAGLGRSLFMYFLLLGFVPLSILSLISYYTISSNSTQYQYQKLTSVLQIKKNKISNYFGQLSEQLRLQSESQNTITLLSEFQQGLDTNNDNLISYIGSPAWSISVNKYAKDLSNFSTNDDYIDIYLVDSNGNIVYSEREGEDLGTNINSKRYENTHFAKSIRRSLESGRPAFSDIAFYKADGGKPAGFIVHTVVNQQGKVLGVIAGQISLQPVETIMSHKDVLAEKIQIYLVGQDSFLRANRHRNDATRLTLKMSNPAITHWTNSLNSRFRNYSITAVFAKSYINSQQLEVMGSYQALNINGIKWALIAEIDKQLALQHVYELGYIILIILVLAMLLIFAMALFVARQIINPLSCITDWAREISTGKLDMTYIISHEKEIDDLNKSMVNIVKNQQKHRQVILSIASENIPSAFAHKKDDELADAINQLTGKLHGMLDFTAAIKTHDRAYPQNRWDDSKAVPKTGINRIAVNISAALADVEQQKWLASGKFQLLQCMFQNERHDKSMAELANNFISKLSRFLDASVGVLYLIGPALTLKRHGSYSYSAPLSASTEFAVGEGVIGQAAMGATSVRLKTVPDEHIDIRIGIGKVTADTVIISPFFHEDELAGVIELAFIGSPKPSIEVFLDSINQLAGSMFQDAKTLDQLFSLASQALSQNKILQKDNKDLELENDSLSQRIETQKKDLLLLNDAADNQRIDSSKGVIDTTTHNIDEKALNLKNTQSAATAFVRQVSAGLRSPLKRMLVLSQTLAENKVGNLNTEQLQSATMIHHSGKDLLRLVNDMSQLVKLENGSCIVRESNFHIANFCEDLKREFSERIQQKSLSMSIHIDSTVPENISSAPEVISQILRNLLANAVKYTAEGSIDINVYVRKTPTTHDALKRSTGAIVFSVVDTGLGIPLEEQNAVFNRLSPGEKISYRDSRSANLSLVISQRLSAVIHAKIELHSKRNRGCRFDLTVACQSIQCETAADLIHSNPAEQTDRIDQTTPSTLENDSATKTANLNEAPAPLEAISSLAAISPAETINSASTTTVLGSTPPTTHIQPTASQPPTENSVHQAPQMVKPSETKVRRPRSKLMLIIDDDITRSKHIQLILRKLDHSCFLTNSGDNIVMLAKLHDPIAIMLNPDMSNVEGLAVLNIIEATRALQNTPIFLLLPDGKITQTKHSANGLDNEIGNTLQDKFSNIVLNTDANVKKLLIIDNDDKIQVSISELFSNELTQVTIAANATDAYNMILKNRFDCVVLGMVLPDMPGDRLLEKLALSSELILPPVIFYTEIDLSESQHRCISKYSDSIVSKTDNSLPTLQKEISAHLYGSESSLPPAMRKRVEMLHSKQQLLQGKSILIVDDDFLTTYPMSTALKHCGMSVVVTDNGKHGLDFLQSNGPFDIILMDVLLPITDGLDAIKMIRAIPLYRELPIIALTAKENHNDRIACLSAGASDYLTKPIDNDKLLAVIQIWLSSSDTDELPNTA
ncbi:MAG: response regulator [Thiohalomonadales bacterium]